MHACTRWIYWTDGSKLQKASITGDDQSTLRSNLYCVEVLTIDYSSLSIYWIDHCLYVIQSLRLDGDETTHTFPFYTTIIFASGLVIYNNTFFWSEQNGVFERENIDEAEVATLYSAPQGQRATGVQLVHPSVQPHGTLSLYMYRILYNIMCYTHTISLCYFSRRHVYLRCLRSNTFEVVCVYCRKFESSVDRYAVAYQTTPYMYVQHV